MRGAICSKPRAYGQRVKDLSSAVAILMICWQIFAMPKPQPKSEKQRKEAEKADRLAEQLRANLRRRKAQAKDMKSTDPE
ncbi:hypothetical protein GCM10009096_21300 [Parasphingorhabdus litoris]|uniref:Uncharacterized protein n=1 Tax=Parasphingorhabdus litoris TaxID=394733 RepID=A0ABN1AKU1_9SPHN